MSEQLFNVFQHGLDHNYALRHHVAAHIILNFAGLIWWDGQRRGWGVILQRWSYSLFLGSGLGPVLKQLLVCNVKIRKLFLLNCGFKACHLLSSTSCSGGGGVWHVCPDQRQLAGWAEEKVREWCQAVTQPSTLYHNSCSCCICVCLCVFSVRYEDPRAVEGLAGALDSRLQVTGVVRTTENITGLSLNQPTHLLWFSSNSGLSHLSSF